MSSEGSFTISLDFELFWGVRANRELEDYSEHLLGVYDAIPKMLALFNKYDIHVTWATVGFLFHETINEIKKNQPDIFPEYENKRVDPYEYIESLNKSSYSENFTKMHVASTLISDIQKYSNQEIASHTFSHFFTYESCKNSNAFYADIKKAISFGAKKNIDLTSLVFPRNQIEKKSIDVLKKTSIESYRGNPKHWAYCEGDKPSKSFFLRLYRLFDTYINLSGHHTSRPLVEENLVELKASMMLRPYFSKLSYLEFLKMRRIKKAMKHAAQKGENFHLWWHPHNFGVNQKENLKNLEALLKYFQELKSSYKIRSLTMKEMVQHVHNN